VLEQLRRLLPLPPAEPASRVAPGDGEITLRHVLQRNWDELWYQPKIDLRTRRLVGAEGLLRARRPDGSVIAPGMFLPGAQDDDMLALTERVILRALRDFEDCAALGASVQLSVNVRVSALVKMPIAQLLREERPAAPTWPGLIFEVTEDEALGDLKVANDVAIQLRELGCALSLDDFGAGYSSLVRLRQLPFSELKIDRSYVSDCHTDRVNAGLCETIVGLGKRFGLRTVAEGIESAPEAEKMQSLGCDIGQGYLYAYPMAKDEFLNAIGRRMIGGPPPVATSLSPGRLLRGLFAGT
jgi:EAL domain-containing protein (putative c-di-GMP-specific phosphodiesterase class I)